MAVTNCAVTLETFFDSQRRKSSNDLVSTASAGSTLATEESPAVVGLRRSNSGSISSPREAHLLVYAEKNSTTLTRFRKLLKGLVDAGLTVDIRSELQDIEADSAEGPLSASAICVLWSPFFIMSYKDALLAIAEKAKSQEIRLLNDVKSLIELADRRWALKMLTGHGIPTPRYAECIWEGQSPARVEEYDEHVVVNGVQIDKPFLEKPVKRSDREIYLYHPQEHGGGRALFSSIESGDDRYICTFEEVGSVRREGSYVYQEYPKSDGFRVQVVCVGMLYYGYCVVSPTLLSSDEMEDAAYSESLASSIQNGHSCVLNLKEKEVAAQLQKIFGQTIFGITFYRSNVNGKEESLVTDLWPGVPRWGIIDNFGDVVNELLKEMQFKPRVSLRSRVSLPMSCSSPTSSRQTAQPKLSRRISVVDGSELLCVVMLVRHGERTPKQKIKGKLNLSNPFQAGWLCGFLQQEDCLPCSEKAFDMRKKHQLKRLSAALAKLMEQGHKLNQVEEALDCIKGAGMDYRAKVVISDGAALQIKIKWGGELTLKGRSGSQESGRQFRERTFPGEDVAQLHTSLQHDIKIFSSREPRCVQTAAAFAKGLLSLSGALPSIVTELVNTLDDAEWGGPSGNKEGRGDAAAWSVKPWEEVEEMFNFCADATLRQHPTPKEAAAWFAESVQTLYKALTKQEPVDLYMGETVTLMKERYKDVAGDLMDEPSFDMFVTVPHAFDHLVYDISHNKELLNEACASAMQVAFEFADKLCQVVAAVEATLTAEIVPGRTSGFKVFFLNRLQRYLRRAAGLPESPRDSAQTDQPKHLSLVDAGVEPVRSRLFFGHSSWLQGVIALLFGSAFAQYLPEGVDTAFARQLRLGFLARIFVRLERNAQSRSLIVIFKFASSDSDKLETIFNLPFEEVDEWWTKVLDAATTPSAL